MIKFFGLIPRRRDISSEEFHDHYRHPHGTLGMQISGFRRYVQSHQFDSPLLGADQTRFEAIAEVWFDTVAAGVGLADDPHYVEHVQPDEPSFVDMDNLKWLYTLEEVVVSGPNPREDVPLAQRLLERMDLQRPFTVKLLHFAAEAGGANERRELAAELGAVRHVRCTPHPEVYAGDEPAFGEVHELWWPTSWDFQQGAGGGEALGALLGRPGSVTLLAQAERFI
jgi:uncharacterized protein (TIGR02118 family)